MYLCYIDESGRQAGKYFVLGGVVVFEKRIYWIKKAFDEAQAHLFPKIKEPITFHASAIRAGHESPWDKLSNEQRKKLLDSIYSGIRDESVYLFGVAVERVWLKQKQPKEDEYGFAFEDLLNRFDRFLKWRYSQEGEFHRGLIIIAESDYHQRLETVAKRIQQSGTRWGGETGTLAEEIPMFTSTANSRLLQAADFCANAIYGRYEGGYTRQFDVIAPKFFQADGVIHGLAHYHLGRCMCIACLSRV